MNEDLAHICAILSAILAAPAVGEDGTYLQQYDMHGKLSPAHRPIQWNGFHKVSVLITRFLDVLMHAQLHHRSLILGASYGDSRFGNPTVTGVPARHDSMTHVVWAKAKATQIKWGRNKCARLSDDTVGPITTAAGHTSTPGLDDYSRPAYALRFRALRKEGKSIKLIPESFDVQAPMLMAGVALALIMKAPNQPNEATPGCEIIQEISRRDADQAASAEANVCAAALAVGAELYGAKPERCMAPLASSSG